MVHDYLFLGFFGMILIACLFLIHIWADLIICRWRDEGGRHMLSDRYFLLTVALFLVAFGCLFLFGNRAADSLVHGVWSVPQDWGLRTIAVLLGSALLLSGKVLMIRVNDMGTRKRRLLPWFLAASALWMAFAGFWLGTGLLPTVESA